MSQIIINEKNFERFSTRMRTLLNEFSNGQISLGKLQSQELFSQILGSENIHELRTNLKKEKIIPDYTFKLSKSELTDFFENKLTLEQEKEFITKFEKRMHYVCSRIADISGYEFAEWDYPFKKNENSPSILNCIIFNYAPWDEDFKKDMKETMQYNLSYTNKKVISYDKYMTSFPTKWLCDDFEPALIDEVKHYSSKELKAGTYAKDLHRNMK